MWAALANGGKTLPESDPEVSEAVDFVEFYRASAREFFGLSSVETHGLGVVVVVPPWNFPIAIPCGGMAAALAAGNTVILKPASDTVLVAWELCQCFWRGGVPRAALQFLPCPGSGAGQQLVTHPQVAAVILTGGTETALRLLRACPALRLFAETGGKNATIVTALADRDQAVKHVLHSAFSHSGQKCSATSLLLLEAEVYDDPQFKRMLVDAVRSLRVGSAWDLSTKKGPLIRPPGEELARALTTLEPGESWAVEPQPVGENPNLWSPGVKWDVQPGSVTHLTEFFGPLLGVMRFTRLSEAIALVNATGYGLESLDEREQVEWRESIHAGNLYINRPTTGAIVLRQPFGGMGKSSFGPGMKAGGPNYVAQLLHFTDRPVAITHRLAPQPRLRDLQERLLAVEIDAPPGEVTRVLAAISNYDRWMREEFGQAHDHFRLLGEDNTRRYRALREVRVRVHPADSVFEIFARACAAQATGCRALISTPPGLGSRAVQTLDDFTAAWAGTIEFLEETDEQLAAAAGRGEVERIRYAAANRVPPLVRAAAAESLVFIADSPVLAEGRVELLWYLREQSVSHEYHRYGNLGGRAGERRAEPL
jgi:RHH-type proline utilization regulon transcriptional repressor/proline dehydrogenase/delta 1-pyrroline-5-carboxylate dehydrogenase